MLKIEPIPVTVQLHNELYSGSLIFGMDQIVFEGEEEEYISIPFDWKTVEYNFDIVEKKVFVFKEKRIFCELVDGTGRVVVFLVNSSDLKYWKSYIQYCIKYFNHKCIEQDKKKYDAIDLHNQEELRLKAVQDEEMRHQKEQEEARQRELLRILEEQEENARHQEELRLQKEQEEELRLQREREEEVRRQEELRLRRERALEARRQEELRLQREREEARLRLQKEREEEVRRQEELRLQREREEVRRQEELRLQREREEVCYKRELQIKEKQISKSCVLSELGYILIQEVETYRQELLKYEKEREEEARRQEELRLQREREEKARCQEELRIQREQEEQRKLEEQSVSISGKIVHLKYKSLSDYVYESSDEYISKPANTRDSFYPFFPHGESRLDYCNDQLLEDALYTVGYRSWWESSKDICQSLYLIDENTVSYEAKTLDDFAYEYLDYKYKITSQQRNITESVKDIVVFERSKNDLFIAIYVDTFGDEKAVREELRDIAYVVNSITNKANHFLFGIDETIIFASFSLTEKKDIFLNKDNILKRYKKNRSLNFEKKCITSEFFNYQMSDEGWTKLKQIDSEDYIRSFARPVEIDRLSAEYIIYELAPFEDSYKLNVQELTSYCRDVAKSIYGAEWFDINDENYEEEIREERLSDEDWDLIEFELSFEDSFAEELVEEYEDTDDFEEEDVSEIPEYIMNDPIAMLKWLEKNS